MPISNSRSGRMFGTLKAAVKNICPYGTLSWDILLQGAVYGYHSRIFEGGHNSPFSFIYWVPLRVATSFDYILSAYIGELSEEMFIVDTLSIQRDRYEGTLGCLT